MPFAVGFDRVADELRQAVFQGGAQLFDGIGRERAGAAGTGRRGKAWAARRRGAVRLQLISQRQIIFGVLIHPTPRRWAGKARAAKAGIRRDRGER